MMPGKTIVLIFVAVSCSTAGQLCLKSGAQLLGGLDGRAFLLAAARDARVLSGLVAWIASTASWLYVLRTTPLSRAYGLSSLTCVLIPLAGAYVFGEQIRPPHVVGILLIVMGIACVLAGGR